MKTLFSKRIRLVFYYLFMLVAFANTAIYLSMRSIWFFIDKTVVGGLGVNLPVALIFSGLFIAVLVYALILLVKAIKKQKNPNWSVKWTSVVFPALLMLVFSAINLYLYSQLGSSRNMIIANILTGLPWFMLVLAVVLLIVVYPLLKMTKRKGFRYGLAIAFVLEVMLLLSDLGGVRITSGPVIQYVDGDSISVLWTTNKESTGYVEYGADENHLERVVSSKDGLIDANTTIHKVTLPLNEQGAFIYRVGSTKIRHYFQNSVEYGNTAISDFKSFKDFSRNNKMTFYILNDLHENVRLYSQFLSGRDYDFLVLNGDLVNSVDNEKVIIDKILKPLTLVTDGTKPFYMVRGNHETRGASSRELKDFLSLPEDRFYYTFRVGPLAGIVLDSGEDKLDSHEEYSGLADFESYLTQETAWLEALADGDSLADAKYKVAFVHIPLNDFMGDASYLGSTQGKWRSTLNKMGINAVFSGHAHSSKVIERDGADFFFDSFIGGGDSLNEKDFQAIKVEVSEDAMRIFYMNASGEAVKEYVVKAL